MIRLYILFFFVAIVFTANAQAPSWEWQKTAGGISIDKCTAMATDAFGNLYVTGNFYSSKIGFGADSLTKVGGGDIYVAKYDPTGNLIWIKGAGGTNNEIVNSIAIDATGIYIVGNSLSSSISFDTITISGGIGTKVFIAKYNFNGDILWVNLLTFSFAGNLNSITTDAFGGIYVTGYYNDSSFVFAHDTLINSGGFDILILKYDSNGNKIWARSAYGKLNDKGTSIASDATGVYVTGSSYSDSLSFSTDTAFYYNMPVGFAYNIFLVKYDVNGNEKWMRKGSGSGSMSVDAIALATDTSGVYVAGYTGSQSLLLGTSGFSQLGGYHTFVGKFNTSGNTMWVHRMNVSAADDAPLAIAADVSGCYISGKISVLIIFAGDTIQSDGGDDSFISKYDSGGHPQWVKTTKGSFNEVGTAVATDHFCNVYFGGNYNSENLFFDNQYITNCYYTPGSGGATDIFISKINVTTGISEKQNLNKITIAPNPFTSQTTISFSEEQKNTLIIITDIVGKELKTTTLTGRQLVIDKGEMQAGIYFVQIIDSNNTKITKKIVVQ